MLSGPQSLDSIGERQLCKHLIGSMYSGRYQRDFRPRDGFATDTGDLELTDYNESEDSTRRYLPSEWLVSRELTVQQPKLRSKEVR